MLPPKVKDSSGMLLLLVSVGEGLGLVRARVLQGVAQPPGAQSSPFIVSSSCSCAHAPQARYPAHQAPSSSS